MTPLRWTLRSDQTRKKAVCLCKGCALVQISRRYLKIWALTSQPPLARLPGRGPTFVVLASIHEQVDSSIVNVDLKMGHRAVFENRFEVLEHLVRRKWGNLSQRTTRSGRNWTNR